RQPARWPRPLEHPCPVLRVRCDCHISNRLARVEDTEGVECLFDSPREFDHVVTQLGRYPRQLERAYSVLTCDDAAESERKVHDLAEGDFRSFRRFRVVMVENDQWVKVAVAGVS